MFLIALLIALGLGGFTTYDSFLRPVKRNLLDSSIQQKPGLNTHIDSSTIPDNRPLKKSKGKLRKNIIRHQANTSKAQPGQFYSDGQKAAGNNPSAGTQYSIADTAYFYLMPDERTRRDIYIIPGEGSVTSINEKNGFIFVAFIDSEGKTTKGWLLKENLSVLNEY